MTPAPLTAAGAVRHIEGLDILGMRFGLQRMRLLLDALGHPERGLAAVHVVGSNGKSSTARMAAAALVSQGRRTGTYLSPHVAGWRDRIEVQGRHLTPERLAAAVTEVRDAAAALRFEEGDAVTQFEVLTAAALVAFRTAGVTAAVVEAGLGGRWDATNVMPGGTVVALTTLDLEHTDLLGDTLEQIAAEKLAVAPDGSGRLVVGRLSPAAADAASAEMARRGLTAWWLGRDVTVRPSGEGHVEVTTPGARYTGLPLPLLGRFQRDNLAVALAAAERLLGHPLDPAPLRRALARVRMPGRLEVVAESPRVVLDGAHNPAGMRAMVASLGAAVGRRHPVAVVSVLGDKDAAAMVEALAPACRALVATRSRHPRAVSPESLAELARGAGLPAEAVNGPPEAALARARALAGRRGAVLVCGSLYLLADLRPGLAPAGGMGALDTIPATFGRTRRQ